MRVFDALRQIRDRHVRSTQVGFTRFAHVQAPISGKPEIGVCSASPLRGPFAVSVLNRRGGVFRPKIMGRFLPATVTAISFCRFHGFVLVDDFRGKCLALRERDYRNVVRSAFIGEIMMPAIDSFLATWSPRVLSVL